MKNFYLIAKTLSGLEPVLAREIQNLGGENVRIGKRSVFYEGDMEMIYKSNYFLRTALRILKEITAFRFRDTDEFYLKCKKVDWEKYLSLKHSFVIRSTVTDSADFRNTMFASLKVKDAIADYFMEKTGKRPDVDTRDADIHIDVHIHRNNCTLSLDSSGESLHKRGYRVHQGKAPLSEVLAAGMILLSGWKGDTDFIDPMCGSGTLPIEAAMIARNIAPGRFRKIYAFENWPDYKERDFEKAKNSQVPVPFRNKIFASDILRENILMAQTNARRARVFSEIEFQVCDMKDLQIDTNQATLIINPPYGERLQEVNINSIYSMIGERLKHQFHGNKAWILTSSAGYLHHVGLKPSDKINLYNGALQCIFASYPLFSGKRNKNN
ncbi:MAG: class I SAM-dependent RNA methyltransferase [Mariniphaga sp.]|nr:class I SAM-dependent RNA methyltransferase [Mariniphaga sp.]MDD4225042.1 class I SAM-dependent RNA methyltransferase [Mariniphaga sp.]